MMLSDDYAARGEKASEAVRVLRLRDMLFRQKGTFTRRLVHLIISIALRLFFRRIEMSGVERVPSAGALVFVVNHPNGLIDPALVFCALPRRVSFLAKSTLFRLPFVGFLMRAVEALPLYRRIDAGEDAARNLLTFKACHELLAAGRCIALFPEGVSHDATQLLPVKTGAARIALGAASFKDDAGRGLPQGSLHIMPVGLFYTSKTTFRSEALVRFGEMLEVASVELDEDGEPPRAAVQTLSRRIEEALRGVTLNTENTEELEEVKKAEELFSSLYESINFRQSLTETFNLLRRLAEGRKLLRTESPEHVERLRRRIALYEEELRSIGVTPGALSVSTHSRWYVVRHFLLRGLLLLLLSPVALAGAAVHFPAYLFSNLFSRLFKTHGPDAIAPTVKILAAIVLMPLTWLAVSVAAYLRWGWRFSLVVFPLTILCGYVALRVFEELFSLRGWLRAVIVLLRRRGLFLRLLLERKALHYEIEQLVRGDKR